MGKQILVHQYIGIPFSNKNKWEIKPGKDTEEFLVHTVYWKWLNEKTIYYMILTIWHSEKGKIIETIKKINGCQGFKGRRRGLNRWSTGNL